MGEQLGEKDYRSDAHAADTHLLGAPDCLIDIESHRLMFGLFKRMPKKNRSHFAIADELAGAFASEDYLRQCCGIML